MKLNKLGHVFQSQLGLSVIGAMFVILGGLSFQIFFLPHYFPSHHWGLGLLRGWDTIYFHNEAMVAFEKAVKLNIRPELHQSNLFISDLMAFIYYYTTPKPWILIFLNALVQGGSLYFLWEVFSNFTQRKSFLLVAVIPYAVFPTTWTWNLQFLKDGISNLSLILFLCGLLGLVKESREIFFRVQIRNRTLLFFGVVIVSYIRSYLTQLLVLLLVFGVCYSEVLKKRLLKPSNINTKLLGNLFIGATIFYGTYWVANHLKEPYMIVDYVGEIPIPIELYWKESEFVPAFIESKFKAISRAREGSVRFGIGKTYGFNISSISSLGEFIRALPLSVLGSLVLPSPHQIVNSDSNKDQLPVWLKASLLLEMGVTYLLLPLALVFIFINPSKLEIVFFMGFVFSFLGIYSIVNVNIGTLHRQVFLQLCLLNGLGLIHFCTIIERLKNRWGRSFAGFQSRPINC